ncbi:MAG: HAMP domain-containing histidine kinase [Oscillospiraceae bacterium]|jgi:signal transduction histidine kinase|nr:HAMP domain-containing histidine kinase [Oscillospiraceae bacterium]
MFIKKRELRRLSADVRGLIDGKELDLCDHREGALSQLKNDIATLASRLREQSEILAREKAGLSTVLADISHQLKTPLTSALMMSELLADEALPPDKREEFLQSLHSSLAHTGRLVQSLLKLAKLDSGTVTYKREEVTAVELVSAAAAPLHVMLEARGQTLRCALPPVRLLCDTTWTSEALTNILKNASEHAPEGGTVTVTAGENTLYAWVCVEDSGQGLTAAQLPRLFERFASENKHGGVGIGLHMARTILRAQDGDLEAALPGAFTLKFYK